MIFEADKKKFQNIRKKPKDKFREKNSGKTQNLSAEEPDRLIEELNRYQAELEMQNKTLLQTQERLEEYRRKYEELYDFAPVGYLVLDKGGIILEANLTASKMIEVTRKKLINTSLYSHFAPPDRDILFLHLRKLAKEAGRHSCEVRLFHKEPDVYFKLDSILDKVEGKPGFCRTTLTDITERKRIENALYSSETQLKLLSSELVETQEKERKRIACDLHDGVSQMLAAGKLNAQTLLSRFPENSSEYKFLSQISDINQQALNEIRRIVYNLRPTLLDNQGIIAAIGYLCRQCQDIYSHISFTREIALEEEEIPELLKSVIFRILQEALANIAKHSKADRVKISLEKSEGALKLVIQDNGRGFGPDDVIYKENRPGGIGVTSMSERARTSGGRLEISIYEVRSFSEQQQ